MRSLIIIEVEHGETTNALDQIIRKIDDPVSRAVYGYTIPDYTVKVDIPPSFRLEQ